jgi:hypothetical protein
MKAAARPWSYAVLYVKKAQTRISAVAENITDTDNG